MSSPSTYSEDISLATLTPLPSSQTTLHLSSDGSNTRNESSLAPVDGGIGAWSFLVVAFFVEAIVWGFPSSFGIFLDSYLSDPLYASKPRASTLLPVIGPLSSGIIYCSGLFVYPMLARYPYHRRTSMWVGMLFCFASLFGASYTKNPVSLLALQGVVYSIGGSLLYSPCISYLSEWFVNRRGLANGITLAGTAVGGLILPLTIPTLISKYGVVTALRILAVGIAIILIPLIPFVKPRLPESRTRQHARVPRNREWTKDPLIWIALAANTLQAFGYFIPVVWLPTFARELDIGPKQASLVIALLNGSSVLGRLSLGYLSDTVEPWTMAMTTLLSASLATFIIWGLLSKTFAGLLAFGITYGIVAGGWAGLWAGFVRPLAKDDPALNTVLFGYFLLSRGFGNILSTPISSFLTNSKGLKDAFPVSGGKYDRMIIYVGTCFAGAAGVSLLGWGVQLRKRAVGAVQRTV